MTATMTSPVESCAPTDLPPEQVGATLGSVFRASWRRLLLTYGLFTLENALRLAQPLLLGLAIDGLLAGSDLWLLVFLAEYLGQLVVGTARRIYDTRTFTALYTDLASGVVARQRADGVSVSQVAARSSLSRELVDFLEHDVSALLYLFFSVGGGVLMLLYYDAVLALYCAILMVPAALLGVFFGRRCQVLNGWLNDQLEREVESISQGERAVAYAHFSLLARWRVKLSDCEAIATGLLDVLALVLLAASLLRCCSLPGVTAGEVFAVLRYVLLVVAGLDVVSPLIQQVMRLRDILRRIRG